MENSGEIIGYIMMAALFIGLYVCTGWAIDLVIRKVKSSTYRIILSLAIIAILFLIWAELAVGIFETYLSGE